MRIGDVGSVSLSGDLLAFSIAVLLVGILGIRIATLDMDHEDDLEMVPLDDIELLQKWGGFDSDGNGMIEPNAPFEIDHNNLTALPLKGMIQTRISWENTSIIYGFDEGSFTGEEEIWIPTSVIVSITILVDYQNNTTPGLMEFCYMEVVS